jgi:hypothetical protein
VFIKFQESPIFFVIYVKKRKIILWKYLFLALDFFYTHGKLIFHETALWPCIMWRCTCDFFIVLPTFQNMSKIYFKINGAYERSICSTKTPLPFILEPKPLAFFASHFVVLLGSYPFYVLELVFILMISSSSSKTNFACITCCIFEFGVFLAFSY